MRLLLNCERPLTHLAATAARSGGTAACSAADRPDTDLTVRGVAVWDDMAADIRSDETRSGELETMIRTVVVGEAADLSLVLTSDSGRMVTQRLIHADVTRQWR